MAHVFQKPAGENGKGILVFTHKEWGYFSANKLLRRFKRENKVPSWAANELRTPYWQAIRKLKKDYLIGVHHGFYYPHKIQSALIDFIMSADSNVPHLSQSIARLPFNSRDFTPSVFSKDNEGKRWDVVTVARDVQFKNYPLLFKSIQKFLDHGDDKKVLLIVPSQAAEKFGKEKNLAKLYYRTFSKQQQSQVTFLYLHDSLEWGLHQEQLAWFYNRCRVFTLFSKKEGESRVVSEALCCGLPVVIYKHFLGGASDLLTDKNSIQFDNFDNAHLAWLEALEKFPDGVLDHPEELTREDFSIERLESAFAALFQDKNIQQTVSLINTDHLDRRLPAHYFEVPWASTRNKTTADILSRSAFREFLESLEDQTASQAK